MLMRRILPILKNSRSRTSKVKQFQPVYCWDQKHTVPLSLHTREMSPLVESLLLKQILPCVQLSSETKESVTLSKYFKVIGTSITLVVVVILVCMTRTQRIASMFCRITQECSSEHLLLEKSHQMVPHLLQIQINSILLLVLRCIEFKLLISPFLSGP